MTAFVRYGFYPLVISLVLIVSYWVASGALPAWPSLPAVVASSLIGIALLERRFPFEPRWIADQGDGRADMIHALVNWGLLSGAGWVAHVGVGMLLGTPTWWPDTWPLAGQLVLVALVIDVGLYTMHVASHYWPWAWRLHAVHHSSERLYWLNGERRHPVSALVMAGPGLAVVAALGAPPILISAWLAVVAVHLGFQHANLDYRLGPLRRWIAGAETHRWHHKRDYEDAQVNFGEMFLVWDRMFGTFVDPIERLAPDAVGLRNRSAPATYLKQLVWPFRVPDGVRQAFDTRLAAGRQALAIGDRALALQAFEAAHVLGQAWTGLHVRSHIALLRWGLQAGRGREVAGQVARIVAAALGTWLWVPQGNPGSTRVSSFARHPIPAELQSILARQQG